MRTVIPSSERDTAQIQRGIRVRPGLHLPPCPTRVALRSAPPGARCVRLVAPAEGPGCEHLQSTAGVNGLRHHHATRPDAFGPTPPIRPTAPARDRHPARNHVSRSGASQPPQRSVQQGSFLLVPRRFQGTERATCQLLPRGGLQSAASPLPVSIWVGSVSSRVECTFEKTVLKAVGTDRCFFD